MISILNALISIFSIMFTGLILDSIYILLAFTSIFLTFRIAWELFNK